jgi:hypothetical protein
MQESGNGSMYQMQKSSEPQAINQFKSCLTSAAAMKHFWEKKSCLTE